jgi:flavin reductase (DIM6/NTAB) family NADH-FMN oxidoreductase RutF
MDRQSFYRLLTATVVPRPTAWVSTVSSDGVADLAPAKLGGKWYRRVGR